MNDEQVALLEEWRYLKAEVERLAPTIAKERELRARVFAAFYPSPKEGTNTAELQDGRHRRRATRRISLLGPGSDNAADRRIHSEHVSTIGRAICAHP